MSEHIHIITYTHNVYRTIHISYNQTNNFGKKKKAIIHPDNNKLFMYIISNHNVCDTSNPIL